MQGQALGVRLNKLLHNAPTLSLNTDASILLSPNNTRRVALLSSIPRIRQFSTVVDDAFSPVSSSGVPPTPTARQGSALKNAVNATAPRFNWSKEEIREIYNTTLMELAFQSAFSFAVSGPNVYSYEYQDWWVQRGLLVLCSKL
ncbi:biotin synthase [Oleoguttula sp. CCFEE 5521]